MPVKIDNLMSSFEYVTVFISIILGLGIAQILTGVADLIHNSSRVKIYHTHLIWIFLVLLLHIQEWWVTFELRDYADWRLPTFIFIMVYPIVLFILARLLFPTNTSEGAINLKEFYFENYRKIFLFGVFLALVSILDNFIIRDYKYEDLIPPIIVFSTLLTLAYFKISNPVIHTFVAIYMILMLIVFLVYEWHRLLLEI